MGERETLLTIRESGVGNVGLYLSVISGCAAGRATVAWEGCPLPRCRPVTVDGDLPQTVVGRAGTFGVDITYCREVQD